MAHIPSFPTTFMPVVLAVMVSPTDAQWLHDGGIWSEEFVHYEGLVLHHSVFDLTVDGDSAIGGLVYKRIYQSGTDTVSAWGSSDPPMIVPIDRYVAAIREDPQNARWWVVLAGYTDELLLYDFELAPGQILVGTFGDCSQGLVVSALDSVPFSGGWRRRFHFSPWDHYVIEGIGANTGLFGHLCPFIEEYGCLNSWSQDNESLLVDGCGQLTTALPPPIDAGTTVEPFPNPVIDRCSIGRSWAGQRVTLLDAMGRPMATLRAAIDGTIDLRGSPPGVYMLRTIDRCWRIVKE